MTWTFVGLLVGLAAFVGPMTRRDIRRANARREERLRRARRRAEINRAVVALQGFGVSMSRVGVAAAGATASVARFGQALEVRSGRRSPFAPHPNQKGRPIR